MPTWMKAILRPDGCHGRRAEGDVMLENTGIYVCTICGFVYIGDDLPEVCPVCKVPNRKFERIGG